MVNKTEIRLDFPDEEHVYSSVVRSSVGKEEKKILKPDN